MGEGDSCHFRQTERPKSTGVLAVFCSSNHVASVPQLVILNMGALKRVFDDEEVTCCMQAQF